MPDERLTRQQKTGSGALRSGALIANVQELTEAHPASRQNWWGASKAGQFLETEKFLAGGVPSLTGPEDDDATFCVALRASANRVLPFGMSEVPSRCVSYKLLCSPHLHLKGQPCQLRCHAEEHGSRAEIFRGDRCTLTALPIYKKDGIRPLQFCLGRHSWPWPRVICCFLRPSVSFAHGRSAFPYGAVLFFWGLGGTAGLGVCGCVCVCVCVRVNQTLRLQARHKHTVF